MGERAPTRWRRGRKPPLVLLHGLGLCWRSWLPLLDALNARHEVFALDLPGFGDSLPLPDELAPTPANLCDAVEVEFDRLGLGAPAVVGNSLGGWLALELARRGRAERVVAIAPSGLELPPERAYLIAVNELMRVRARLGAPLGRALTAAPPARVALFSGLRSRPWRLPAAEAARELRCFGCSPGFQATLRETLGARAATGLADIRAPVRIAFGTLDFMLGPFTAPRFCRGDSRRRTVAAAVRGTCPDARRSGSGRDDDPRVRRALRTGRGGAGVRPPPSWPPRAGTSCCRCVSASLDDLARRRRRRTEAWRSGGVRVLSARAAGECSWPLGVQAGACVGELFLESMEFAPSIAVDLERGAQAVVHGVPALACG